MILNDRFKTKVNCMHWIFFRMRDAQLLVELRDSYSSCMKKDLTLSLHPKHQYLPISVIIFREPEGLSVKVDWR